MKSLVAPLRAHALSGAGALLFSWLVAHPSPAGALVNYNWASPVTGSADNPALWNPASVPTSLDNVNFGWPGTYTVTYPAGMAATNLTTLGAGNVTFNVTSPHTTKELLVGGASGSPTMTVSYGTMYTDYLNLGQNGSLSRLTLTGSSLSTSAIFHSKSKNNRNYGGVGGDAIGYGGITYLDIFGGAWYFCERTDIGSWPMRISMHPTDVTTVSIAGRNAMTTYYSTLKVTGESTGDGLVIGYQGTGSLYAYNGGHVDVAGNLVLGQLAGSYGYGFVGPVAVTGTSWIRTTGHLQIGNNEPLGDQAGYGELTVKNRAWVAVEGRGDVGDPDNDTGSFLRVLQGGTFRVNGGIKFWQPSGTPLDLRGGLTHIRGGAFLWPANKYLSISSQVGTPELAISSGTTSTGPATTAGSSQLFVGRGGAGTLRLTQPGTVFAMGAGSTTVADSLGGTGTVIVDSLAVCTSAGPFHVGVRGNGTLNVTRGSQVDVGAMTVGTAATGFGVVTARGAGSLIQVRDNLWIAGDVFGAPGGAAQVSVDSSATINVLHTGGVNPARATIHPAGSLTLTYGGRLTTSGTVSNSGTIVLNDGSIEALNVSQPPSGIMYGWGQLVAMLQNSGRVSPSGPATTFGHLRVDGTLTQYGGGRFRADLGTAAGLQCDTLEVSGAVALDGTLELTTTAGFAGNPGDVFTILTGHPVTGTFASVTFNGGPLPGSVKVLYDPTSVRILVPGIATGVETDTADLADLRFAPTSNGGDRLAFALDLPLSADVDVRIYDLRGRQVATIPRGTLGQGPHRLLADTNGRTLPSGVYFARAEFRAGTATVVRTARALIVH